MECFIVDPADIEGGRLYLRDEEAHHALKSMRLRVGDPLMATDLSGTCYVCRVFETLQSHEVVLCSIEQTLPEFGEPERDVLLIQGMLAQPARWEFLLEKATELGVRAVAPVTTERTEREHFKRDRSERILRAAVKQTKRARLPELRLRAQPAETQRKAMESELSTLSEALSVAVQEGRAIVLLHESASLEANLRDVARELGTSIALVVGPEGGFSEDEVRMATQAFGAKILSLGARRLRAETAAIAALAIAIDK